MRMNKVIFTLTLCMIIQVFSREPLTVVNAQEKREEARNVTSAPDITKDTSEDLYDYSPPKPVYDSMGKRDPFKTLIPKTTDEEKKLKDLFNYEGALLKGIINSDDDTYALVVDANGFAYVLREGYRVYGGYVERITKDAMYLHIVKYGRSMSIIMRLASTKTALIEEVEKGESFVKKPGITITYQKDTQVKPRILIENVIVPSLDTKTVEEEWFGIKDSLSDTNEANEGTASGNERSFSLIDPADNTWITLPYIFNWTKMNGIDVYYTIVIDDNPDFSSPLFQKGGIVPTSFLIGEDTGLPKNRELYWKVIAQDTSGNEVICRKTDMSFKIKGN